MDKVTSVKVTNSFEQDARYLTMIFVTLKLCGVIEWSWWWVISPVFTSLDVRSYRDLSHTSERR